MALLLLLQGGDAPPPPDQRQGLTRLGLGAVPARPYGTFPNRAPQTVLPLDPANLTWTGQTLNAPLRLALGPADLRWVGLHLPGSRATQLGLGAWPTRPYGAFIRRAPQTVLVLDPATLTWTGQTLTVGEDTLLAADLTWIGQDMPVWGRTTRAWTRLGLLAVPTARHADFRRTVQLPLDPADLTWVGQPLSVALALQLDPMDLTWLGQPIVQPRRVGSDRGLQPLTGVR